MPKRSTRRRTFRCFWPTAVCLLCLELASTARGDDVAADPPATVEDADVRASGLVQVDGVIRDQTSVDQLDPGSGAPLNRDQFAIPRAWLTLDGRYGYARGFVQLEGSTRNGPALRLLAAELSVGYPKPDRPWVEGALGLFLIPFGLETQEVVPRRMFLEASTWVNALFPGRRDLGARVAGSYQFVRYQLALMNGDPSAASAFPLVDSNRAKDVLGRLAAYGDVLSFLKGEFGVSGVFGRGFHAGARPTKDSIITRDANEDGIVQPSEIQLVTGDPGEPSRNFGRYAIGADIALHYTLPVLGTGRSYGEIAWAKNMDRALFVADPVAQGRASRELGLMLAFRQQITRHAEVGVRYDRYQPDLDARTRAGLGIHAYDARVATWALALAWCTLKRLRVTLEYDHQTNPFGRNASGAPSTLAADTLTLRAQLEI